MKTARPHLAKFALSTFSALFLAAGAAMLIPIGAPHRPHAAVSGTLPVPESPEAPPAGAAEKTPSDTEGNWRENAGANLVFIGVAGVAAGVIMRSGRKPPENKL